MAAEAGDVRLAQRRRDEHDDAAADQLLGPPAEQRRQRLADGHDAVGVVRRDDAAVRVAATCAPSQPRSRGDVHVLGEAAVVGAAPGRRRHPGQLGDDLLAGPVADGDDLRQAGPHQQPVVVRRAARRRRARPAGRRRRGRPRAATCRTRSTAAGTSGSGLGWPSGTRPLGGTGRAGGVDRRVHRGPDGDPGLVGSHEVRRLRHARARRGRGPARAAAPGGARARRATASAAGSSSCDLEGARRRAAGPWRPSRRRRRPTAPAARPRSAAAPGRGRRPRTRRPCRSARAAPRSRRLSADTSSRPRPVVAGVAPALRCAGSAGLPSSTSTRTPRSPTATRSSRSVCACSTPLVTTSLTTSSASSAHCSRPAATSRARRNRRAWPALRADAGSSSERPGGRSRRGEGHDPGGVPAGARA